jgi:hypothetical protein
MPNGLPQQFYPLFWDVEPEKLHARKDSIFILERLLEMGDDAALCWIRLNYPEETIREVVKNSRRLSRKTARFWQVFLQLKEEEVKCLSRSYRQAENPLWPY